MENYPGAGPRIFFFDKPKRLTDMLSQLSGIYLHDILVMKHINDVRMLQNFSTVQRTCTGIRY